MRFRCERVTDDETMEAARRVRRRVFIEEQGVPEAEEWDAFDATAVHLALRAHPRAGTRPPGVAPDRGAVVGTARLLEKGEGWFKVGRLAVLPEARRHGGGTLLMAAAAAHARARGATGLVLDAQVPVIPFYERLGFVAEGEVFMDAGIPHRRMTRKLEEP